ncbi:MAG TPA: hypothetical protein VKB46_11870 [Pyrinomonadaceae bacterium]|nr:hypothetical protein [Pyrinomonadaceae bacterium]
MFNFEHRRQPLAPFRVFVWRVIKSIMFGCGLIAVALSIGISGYHWIAGFNWVDSLLEASMILGGMGPVNPLAGDGAKIFASGYALFSGLVFIGVMGIVLSPAIHRMIHKFHLEQHQSDE